ncbi:UNKNOWN [Stylonychia lemnae]|uniref:Uncharacterized protein n=1 Tax=Stylonychia lemnae TaxID=5949 RepID=A0A077ZUT9_STYLE|nr:UNKNOWN [Stylonychia lemnae]|eukprot:CDW73675.1 UNKNOWN [Stylonychia lemnae]
MQAFLKQRKVETEQPKEIGQYVPKDARKEVVQELKRSHFVLGSDSSDFRTKNQVAQQDQNWKIDLEEKQIYNRFSQQIKQSHVQIGMNNKTSFQTTHEQNYDKKTIDQNGIIAAQEAKKDLRKSHFNFGSLSVGADSFVTTNQERFKSNPNLNPADLRPQIKGQDSRENKIVTGKEKPNYQTSMKDSLASHDLAESYKNMQQQQEQGRNVRQHHFQFGYNGEQSVMSEYQNFQNDRSKSVALSGPIIRSANDIKKTTIELGNKWHQNDYTSMMKMNHQVNSLTNREPSNGLSATELANVAKLDLRKSHFMVGSAPTINESSAKSAFKSHDITNDLKNEKLAIQSRMQKGNFKIGDEKAQATQFDTSYKAGLASADRIHNEIQNKSEEKKPVYPSINLGFGQNDYISEAKSKFQAVQGDKEMATKSIIEKNRNPHFKFGDGLSHDMTSVSKQQFDYKGNASEIRGFLDESRKQDLKQHHFAMGSHTTEYQTSNQKQLNTDQTNNQLSAGAKFETKSLLKNSGQRIFGGNMPQGIQVGAGADYKTTNQSYIKWIQPAPTQIQMNMGGPSKQ